MDSIIGISAWSASHNALLNNTMLITALAAIALMTYRLFIVEGRTQKVILKRKEITQIVVLADEEARAVQKRIREAAYMPEAMKIRFLREFRTLHARTMCCVKRSDLHAAIQNLIRIQDLQGRLTNELIGFEYASNAPGRSFVPESETLTRAYRDRVFRRISPTLEPLKQKRRVAA